MATPDTNIHKTVTWLQQLLYDIPVPGTATSYEYEVVNDRDRPHFQLVDQYPVLVE